MDNENISYLDGVHFSNKRKQISHSKERINILVYLMSTSNLVPALAAITTLHPDLKINITFLVYWSGETKRISEKVGLVIGQLTRNIKHVKELVVMSESEFHHILTKPTLTDSFRAFTSLFQASDFDEIYYSHDFIGSMYQFLCTLYPYALRVCFGDAFGIVFEKRILLSLVPAGILEKFKSLFLSRRKQTLASGLSAKEFVPDCLVLVLPIFQSKGYLSQRPLLICQKIVVDNTLKEFIRLGGRLQKYVTFLLSRYKSDNKYLILTDNFTEAGVISKVMEINMWSTIISEYVPIGSTVFVKAHPGERWNRARLIAKQLAGNYKIIETDSKYSSYPIELWEDLIKHTQVISLSYPIISLKYLYNKDVIFPLDDKFIQKWFEEKYWKSCKDTLTMYKHSLIRLKNWDRNSVLWQNCTQ